MYTANEKRYDKMKYNRCGYSGLMLPAVSLGLWHNFGDTASYANMEEMCFTAFDNGITHFDLANNYGRKYLIASLDQSLKRMGLEYVDIFYHHRMDPETPLEETMGALEQIVRSGKALYAGLSNYDGPTLEKASAILEERHVPFIINQNRYNILDRTIEQNGLKETSHRLGKGIICFSPLAQGMLTDRYLNGIPADSRVRTDGRFLRENQVSDDKLDRIRKLNEIAAGRGQTLAEMALAWILKDGIITTVLIGASKASQILDNIKATENTTFSEAEIKAIDDLSL